jgi:zinc transport system substrate-binding protein
MRLQIATALCAALLTSCSGDDAAPAATEPTVFASFYPLAYFTHRIAGDKVEVDCALPPDADPEFWHPSRFDVAALQGAALVVVNGASFEKWLDQVSLPASRVVDTTHACADRLLKFATVTHSHGPGGEHTHEGTDGHTWLDPHLAKVQSQAVHDALARTFPAHASAFAKNLAALHRDLDALDAQFRDTTTALAGRPLLAAHPAYNYLAARYGWRITDVDLDPDAEWDDAGAARVRQALRDTGAALLLWESEPEASVATSLAALGVRSVVFSPVETPDTSGKDYLARMQENLTRLRAAAAP